MTKTRIEGIRQLLELIDEVNKDIAISQKMNSPSMIRQYQHLKNDYTRQLLELLKDYQLPLQIIE